MRRMPNPDATVRLYEAFPAVTLGSNHSSSARNPSATNPAVQHLRLRLHAVFPFGGATLRFPAQAPHQPPDFLPKVSSPKALQAQNRPS